MKMKHFISSIKHQRDIKLVQNSGLFDENYYIAHHPEVLKSGLCPLEHYMKIGSGAGMKPNGFFDDHYYRQTYPDIGSNTNPLVHFIKFGAREGRNPSRIFNTSLYLQKHPDVAATNINPLWHFLKYGAAEQREIDNARSEALSDANKALYSELIGIEPLLPTFDSLRYVPLVRHENDSLVGRAYARLTAAITEPFTHLLLLRWLIHGGASTLAMYFAKAIKDFNGEMAPLVLLVDQPDQTAAHLLPQGVRMLAIDEIQPGLSAAEKVELISRFILQTQPQMVHNIESDVGWQAISKHAKLFRTHSSVVGSLFMFCYDDIGSRVGNAAQYMNSCIDNVDVMLVDNNAIKTEARHLYGFSSGQLDKISVVYTPILSKFHPPDPKDASSKRILWSSRLHKDKRPDLLLKIAQCLPEFTFEIHGDISIPAEELSFFRSQQNIRLHGPYKRSEDLPHHGIGAYLHTTKHEGGAITMKEAIAAGLPAIAPPLGVIPEIIGPDTGWLVADSENPHAYADAIRDCVSRPEERTRRVINSQKILMNYHSWTSFRAALIGCTAYQLGQSLAPEQLLTKTE